jgi:predicted negative regulator of RcsB-dependent stress response
MATTATTAPPAGGPAAADSRALARLTDWIKSHKQAAVYAALVLALVGGLYGWTLLTARTAERSAGRELEQGRLALDSKNYPLAASVLSRVVENFSGTHAAQEGMLLLAQVRLGQGQSQQAIELLQRYAPKADRDFRAQAYGLLGAAYENVARPKDAATAYAAAADAAPFPFLRAQYLSDAGRAWVAAGDTARAVTAYRTVVERLDSTTAAGEAKVRLGELTKGAGIKGLK